MLARSSQGRTSRPRITATQQPILYRQADRKALSSCLYTTQVLKVTRNCPLSRGRAVASQCGKTLRLVGAAASRLSPLLPSAAALARLVARPRLRRPHTPPPPLRFFRTRSAPKKRGLGLLHFATLRSGPLTLPGQKAAGQQRLVASWAKQRPNPLPVASSLQAAAPRAGFSFGVRRLPRVRRKAPGLRGAWGRLRTFAIRAICRTFGPRTAYAVLLTTALWALGSRLFAFADGALPRNRAGTTALMVGRFAPSRGGVPPQNSVCESSNYSRRAARSFCTPESLARLLAACCGGRLRRPGPAMPLRVKPNAGQAGPFPGSVVAMCVPSERFFVC